MHQLVGQECWKIAILRLEHARRLGNQQNTSCLHFPTVWSLCRSTDLHPRIGAFITDGIIWAFLTGSWGVLEDAEAVDSGQAG